MHRRTPADADQLAEVLRAVFGTGRRVLTVDRLAGASKKGVYRAVLDGGATAVVYVWAPAEDYWGGAEARDLADPFSHASGIDLLVAAQARLAKLGIRTPDIYLADTSRAHYPADVAVVEDVPGPSLEEVLRADPDRARPTLTHLGQALRTLHADKAPSFGKLLHVSNGGTASGMSCEQVVLDRALTDLADAATRVPRISRASSRLAATLHERAAGISPRSEYSLVHGELGPDHVLIDGRGRPVVVDTEGVMYFDVEWEHVFLRLRFGEHYRALHEPGLDQRRLHLYKLAMHLSLVAGPLRLLDGDYPERDTMVEIVEYNADQALK